MSWARLDDKFHDNPKIVRVGLPALGLYAIGLSYCADHLTDGFIPQRVANGMPGSAAASKALLEAQLWHPAPGGYVVHDYLDWNRSREQVLAERAQARKRKTHSGRKNGAIPAGVTPNGGSP